MPSRRQQRLQYTNHKHTNIEDDSQCQYDPSPTASVGHGNAFDTRNSHQQTISHLSESRRCCYSHLGQ